MTGTEQAVAAHYTTGALFEKIVEGLVAQGKDLTSLRPDDLVPAEHFHTGGKLATDRLLDNMRLAAGAQLLDIGCGIGGVARAAAVQYDARVFGVDLTPEFVETATALSAAVGLSDRTRFMTGSALDLPVDSGAFDAAVMVHVGMNIADKSRLFAQAFAALKPGGLFGVFDTMLAPLAEDLAYPVPWAETPETSFPESPEVYREAAAEAGFLPVSEVDYSVGLGDDRVATVPVNTDQPLGPFLMMGHTAAQKLRNHRANLSAGRVSPVEMIFRR
ncbi:MAG: class I SAM-dependent methyltransferase [Pseudomonadota bacterium]